MAAGHSPLVIRLQFLREWGSCLSGSLETLPRGVSMLLRILEDSPERDTDA